MKLPTLHHILVVGAIVLATIYITRNFAPNFYQRVVAG